MSGTPSGLLKMSTRKTKKKVHSKSRKKPLRSSESKHGPFLRTPWRRPLSNVGEASLSHKGHVGAVAAALSLTCAVLKGHSGHIYSTSPGGCKNSAADSGLAANGFPPPLAICGLGQTSKYSVAVPLSKDRLGPWLLNTNTDTFPIAFL